MIRWLRANLADGACEDCELLQACALADGRCGYLLGAASSVTRATWAVGGCPVGASGTAGRASSVTRDRRLAGLCFATTIGDRRRCPRHPRALAYASCGPKVDKQPGPPCGRCGYLLGAAN